MMQFNPSAINVGDRVQLKWTGYPNLPKWLTLTWATVIRRTRRGYLIVQPDHDSGTRSIDPASQVYHHIPKDT